jgi:hypothetical protein
MTTPGGLKAKATELGTKAFMAAPPPAQNAILNGIGKAQPVVTKVQPYAKQIVGGVLGLAVLKRLRK